jgi:hypothetical protein
MPPINATVNWDDGSNKGTVGDIQVPAANGATVIQWSCGTNVASFAITGLDSSVFNPNGSNGQVTNFSVTDSNNNSGTYNYTVTATHQDGRMSSHDPKIENGT